MRVYDFKCVDPECGAVSEQFVRNGVDTVTCPACKAANAERLVSAPLFKLDGVSGHFPTALQKWEQRHSRKRT